MMKSRLQPHTRSPMLPVLLIACTSLTAIAPMAAQTDARVGVKVPAAAAPAPLPDVPKIAYTKFVLPNGLTVLLHEDHSAPLVSVDLQYHVGSRDDIPGKRGLAHVFEHMMFNGSANVGPGEHLETLAKAGGMRVSAYTQTEGTAYFETVPTNMLETALWLEAERMAFLPARLDSERFERERDAVTNEYAMAAENPRTGLLPAEAFLGALFPDPNPYSTTAFGVMSELKTATVKDLRAFFDRYYVPNNATLAIAGDVSVADARKMVERYFGGIPRHATVTHPAVPKTVLAGESRFAFEDKRASTLQLWIGWRGAPTTNQDRIALTALSAILTRGRNSRLYRALVDGKRLATDLPPQNAHYDFDESGIFQILVSATPNGSLTEIEKTVDSVVAGVRDGGVTADELRRWQASNTVSTIVRLQRTYIRDSLLAEGQLFQNNPSALFDELTRARQLTPADLQRVARKYLGPARVVLSVVPAGKLELVSKPSEPYVNKTH